ncbi:hypothetical protein EPUS_03471 [Endocarpon pusillum Z07020]|uniref:Uncharacterized protein n=1 Tax=Endocarpon pusillum (strain Z07020 / HMAS-L-300199) TaxID=1263415 RepID=U1G228_ENDPU|nr:uncharacterized protein EPUS_03471 [Endocarpon pusillum Z07020]ERF71317.1 hypothetical protein EPUS_03471 [Endocarpon pusillum Z07020]
MCERTWACLPITALAYVSQPHQDLLLSGQGSTIKVESVTRKDLLAREQVFDFQSIHGITAHDDGESQSKITSVFLLIWGGRRLALGRIDLTSTGLEERFDSPPLKIGHEVEAADWILDASFANFTTTSPFIAYLVTAHNDVCALTLDSPSDLSVKVCQVASGLSSILYSAHIKPTSSTTILVAAGTVFGQVIVWSCYHPFVGISVAETGWQSHTSNIFHGHDGSIFGVSLSNGVDVLGDCYPRRFLASCSDDRTIRIWDVGNCDCAAESSPDAQGQKHKDILQIGLGSTENASLATTWGHASRIWGLEFIPMNNSSSVSKLRLISRGEDATCQVWDISHEAHTALAERADLRGQPFRLSHTSTDHYHSGKHIWSHTHHFRDVRSAIFTGGGDGRIIARMIPTLGASSPYFSITTPFCSLFETIEPKNGGSNSHGIHDSVKQYVFASDTVILATTNGDHVMRGVIEVGEHSFDQYLSISWTCLCNATEFGTVDLMTGDALGNVVYLGGATGKIWIYQHGLHSIQFLTTTDWKISNIFAGVCTIGDDGIVVRHLFVCSTIPMCAKVLQITQSSGGLVSIGVSRTVDISLPPTFQPTAFLDGSAGSILVLGSRSGAFAVYHDVFRASGTGEQIAPNVCIRHVHGSDSVTSLQYLPAITPSKHKNSQFDVLSTGRDGAYAIHRVTLENTGECTTHINLTTLHRSCPPFGPNIEGASIMASSGGTELSLHGFSGKNFVVWNESTDSEMMSIPCGGAHRRWAYHMSGTSEQLRTTSQSRCFAWTKAGVFNLVKASSPAHEVFQPGGHGREIKAMALCKRRLNEGWSGASTGRLIATGAEDTAIRLWSITNTGKHGHTGVQGTDSRDAISCTQILKKHTTGIQHLSFCKDFLFSSAGCEELYIWKINFGVSLVGIGTVFQAALPKHAPASDLRITNFEVVFVSGRYKDDSSCGIGYFLIHVAYSNSMIRVFKYTNDQTSSPENRFQLLGQGFYNTTCLTSISGLIGCLPWFLAASTNGAVTIWPDLDHRRKTQDSPSLLSRTTEHFIHQNAILALHTVSVAPNHHLLLTGGDDNAFGITLIREGALGSVLHSNSNDDNNTSPLPRFRTLLIPKAHVAAITALEILDSRRQAGLLVLTVISTGNDQRVKIWRITVDVDQLPRADHSTSMGADLFGPEVLEAIDVQLVREVWTDVADASSVVVIPDADATVDRTGNLDLAEVEYSRWSKRLLIAGIGMEMIRIDLVDEGEEA